MFDRRDFLKLTAAVGAVGALGIRDTKAVSLTPIMVLPTEAPIQNYIKTFGHAFLVRREDMGRLGLRTDRIVFFGFTGLPKRRIDRCVAEFSNALRPGGTIEFW